MISFNFDNTVYEGICIPYARFSTEAQAEIGRKSLERQIGEAKRYAAENNLFIDDNLIFADKGVSGYALQGDVAKTFEKGQMQVMLSMLQNIPADKRHKVYIAFHNFDRFSRMSPDEAQKHFKHILNQGFNIVTTIDNCVYSRSEMDMDKMLVSIIHMCSAHYESEVKSKYILDAYERKRNVIEYLYNDPNQKGKHKHIGIKTYCPTWINRESIIYKYEAADGSEKLESLYQFSIDEDKAKIINEIFDMKIAGMGHTKICKVLNDRGVDTFQKGKYRKAKNWHIFAIHNLFKNEHVIGHTYLNQRQSVESFNEASNQFKTERVKQVVTEKLHNYYPAIISQEKYEEAHKVLQANKSSESTSKGKDKTHIFSHVMKCSCGGRLVYKSTKKKTVKKVDDYYEYMRCERSILNDNCTSGNIGYKEFEQRFIDYAKHIDIEEVVSEEAENLLDEYTVLSNKLNSAKERQEKAKVKSDGLAKTFNSAVAQGLDASFVLNQMGENDKVIATLATEIAKYERELRNVEPPEEEPKQVEDIAHLLKSKVFDDVLEARKQVNEYLKSKVRWMEVCSTAFHKFVLVCFVDNKIRTYAYQDEFASDLMFNSIKINTDGLSKKQADGLMVELIKAVRLSLQGKNEVVTNSDLLKHIAETKKKYISNCK
ncbi:recombinase family protein [Vibrio parahaemolyticus]|nr:recombinase family protein [Vibrio parahaemolyticus]EJR2787880.1 recombinase family protein [Vibrio parahaemolyticus]